MEKKLGTNKKIDESIRLLQEGLIESLHHHKFEEITITQLSQYSGVSRKTFYNHFNNKLELLDSLLLKICDDFQRQYAENKYRGIELYKSYFTYWNKNRTILTLLHDNYLFWRLIEATSNVIGSSDNHAMDNLKSDMHKSYYAEFVAWSLCSFLHKWTVNGFKEDVDELSSTLAIVIENESNFK